MTQTGRVSVHRYLMFAAIALGGAAFDLATKSAVFRSIGRPQSPPYVLVPNLLELQTSYNPGALWGLGRNLPYGSVMFASLSLAAVVAICWWLFVRNAAHDVRLTAAFGLITAGALGNGYDRIVLGQVRDFVHFHVDSVGFDCAIFNFADNMLVAGAIVLLWLAFRPERVAKRSESESSLEETISTASGEPAEAERVAG